VDLPDFFNLVLVNFRGIKLQLLVRCSNSNLCCSAYVLAFAIALRYDKPSARLFRRCLETEKIPAWLGLCHYGYVFYSGLFHLQNFALVQLFAVYHRWWSLDTSNCQKRLA
jgi:hypothetical protein